MEVRIDKTLMVQKICKKGEQGSPWPIGELGCRRAAASPKLD